MSSTSTPAFGPVRAGLPWNWQATAAEVERFYGCDATAPPGAARMLRAVGVDCPPALVFDWLGNLRLAPYSYDRLDNWGRRSPRELRTDLPALAVGDQVMTMFTTVGVVPGRELTIRSHPGPGRAMFGDVIVSYAVDPDPVDGAGRSRLVAALRFAGGANPLSRARRYALAWGDLLMMRKQLLTLAGHAEASARSAAA